MGELSARINSPANVWADCQGQMDDALECRGRHDSLAAADFSQHFGEPSDHVTTATGSIVASVVWVARDSERDAWSDACIPKNSDIAEPESDDPA